jgi:hypothetical protein
MGIKSLLKSFALAVHDNLFNVVDHTAESDVIIDYYSDYPTLHKFLGMLPNDAVCFDMTEETGSLKPVFECFSTIDMEHWDTEQKKVITGEDARDIKAMLFELKPEEALRAFGAPKL